MQQVAIPYLCSLRLSSILLDDTAYPHRVWGRDYPEKLGVERMVWTACSPDFNLTKHLWNLLVGAVVAEM